MPKAIANIRPTRAGRPRYRYSDQYSALTAEIAASIDVPPSAIRIWRSRHQVSHNRRLPIYREARRRGVDLPDAAFNHFASSAADSKKTDGQSMP
jgi:hypothetical protein